MRDGYADVEHWATISLIQWVVDGESDRWLVTGVNVQRQFRGQGWASKLLDQVIADADAEGVTLFLHIEPDTWFGAPGLDEEQLRAFYGRHGFVDKPELDHLSMERKPCSLPDPTSAATSPSATTSTSGGPMAPAGRLAARSCSLPTGVRTPAGA